MSTEYIEGRSVVTSQPQSRVRHRLFQQGWWQEASGGDQLERVEVIWDGSVVCRLCFVTQRIYGLHLLKLPPYTRTQGPDLFLPDARPTTHLRNVRRAIDSLVKGLPKHDRFHIFLDPEDSLAFDFWLAGCSIEQDFTFRIAADKDLEDHWFSLDSKTRNMIVAAERRLIVEEADEIESFIDLSIRERPPASSRHNFSAMRRIAIAAASRHQFAVLRARNDSGSVIAASVLVWDDEVLFYWQSARDPKLHVPGANNLLIWRSMQFAKQRGLCFDLDGCHSRSAANFAVKFGMPSVVRPSIIHMSTAGRLAREVSSFLGRQPRF